MVKKLTLYDKNIVSVVWVRRQRVAVTTPVLSRVRLGQLSDGCIQSKRRAFCVFDAVPAILGFVVSCVNENISFFFTRILAKELPLSMDSIGTWEWDFFSLSLRTEESRASIKFYKIDENSLSTICTSCQLLHSNDNISCASLMQSFSVLLPKVCYNLVCFECN